MFHIAAAAPGVSVLNYRSTQLNNFLNCTTMSASVPFTEQSNRRTEFIDVASPEEIVKLLNECNDEIFDGIRGFENIFCERILQVMEEVGQTVVEIMQAKGDTSAIVLSGCGTSGRLAFLISRAFNKHLVKAGLSPRLHYIIAGGDKALFTSQEAPEDDPWLGVEELRKVTVKKTKVLYIGITCGFSSAFVAGQLHYCLEQSDVFSPVLVGFNPLCRARKNPIENWDKTFFQVAEMLQAACLNKKGFLLNPVVGAEPIRGSSRMKGGTVTKILLEAIFIRALMTASGCSAPTHTQLLRANRVVCLSMSQCSKAVAGALREAEKSLSSGGRICYVGAGGVGILSLIDASECLPTFGSGLNDVRGFLEGGYVSLQNKEGDLSNLGEDFHISTQHFENAILPTLKDRDLVISLISEKDSTVLTGTRNHTYVVLDECPRQMDVDESRVTRMSLPWKQLSTILDENALDVSKYFLKELLAKLTLNVISTGAFVLYGKVYGNVMIDVSVRNTKLYHRAVGIVKELSNSSEEVAIISLMKAIYQEDDVKAEMKSAPISDLVKRATNQSLVVPVAVILAISGVSVSEARRIVTSQRQVRLAMGDVIANR